MDLCLFTCSDDETDLLDDASACKKTFNLLVTPPLSDQAPVMDGSNVLTNDFNLALIYKEDS